MECIGAAHSTVRTAVRSVALVVGMAAIGVLAAGGVAAGRATTPSGPGSVGATTFFVALPERVRASNRAW
jgi:hypothetical protein